jgi:hypothetical protein
MRGSVGFTSGAELVMKLTAKTKFNSENAKFETIKDSANGGVFAKQRKCLRRWGRAQGCDFGRIKDRSLETMDSLVRALEGKESFSLVEETH